MNRTRVKICGITRPQDAVIAAEAGADAVGMMLHANVPRLISVEDAGKIIGGLPPLVAAIGLFVDAEASVIRAAFANLQLAAVQLHGQETPAAVVGLFPIPVIKVLHVTAATLGEQLQLWKKFRSPNLKGILLDTAGGGGKGMANDWETVERHLKAGDFEGLPPWIAAGGLNAGNVGQVVRKLRPYAVDVSSGVERAPCQKSEGLIGEFLQAVRHADGN